MSSFEDFYDVTARATFATAFRAAGDRDVAADATHDAYVVMFDCWETRCRLPLPENQRYATGIALHKVADWFRRRGRFVSLTDEDGPPCVGQEHLVDQEALFNEVREFLESRSVVSRSVGLLYFFADFTPAEIAEILGMAPSTVRTHLHRLRPHLQALVERMDWLEGRRRRDG